MEREPTDDDPICNVVNVVATYSYRCKLNTTKIALYCRDAIPVKYNPVGFSALIIPFCMGRLPATTALVYPSGVVVHTGGRSEDHVRYMALRLTLYLSRSINENLTLHDFQIRNIVSDMNTGFMIDRFGLNRALGSLATLLDDRIQCVICRDQEDLSHVSLVYTTGAIVLTGNKDRADIIKQYWRILRIAEQHMITEAVEPSRAGSGSALSVEEYLGTRTEEDKPYFNPIDPFDYLDLNCDIPYLT